MQIVEDKRRLDLGVLTSKEKVVAVYPDAECKRWNRTKKWLMTRYAIFLNDIKWPRRPYAISAESEERAWEAAAEKMDREYE